MTCNELQKDLALTAAGVLDKTRLTLVREHVRTCRECAARLRSYESICAAHLSAAAELQELPPLTPTLTRNLNPTLNRNHNPTHNRNPNRQLSPASELQEARAHPFADTLWRWLIPVAGIGAATAIFLLTQKPVSHKENPPAQLTVHSDAPSKHLAVGTLARYRKALQEPGEASLDSLLAHDADVLLRTPSRTELQQLRSEVLVQ